MGKVDTTGIEELFLETPIKKVGRAKPVRRPKNSLGGFSSWQLCKELFGRHNINLQIAGFWILIAVIVWNRLA